MQFCEGPVGWVRRVLQRVSLPVSLFPSLFWDKDLPALPTENNQANVLNYSLRLAQLISASQREEKKSESETYRYPWNNNQVLEIH